MYLCDGITLIISVQNGDSALYHASERGLVSVVQALVGAHVNTNQKNKVLLLTVYTVLNTKLGSG